MGTKKQSHKFTLKQFVWNGFNTTVGIAFLGSVGVLANEKASGSDNLGLGLNIIWIFIILAVIASICAFAFVRLSRIHKQDANGGAYIFARSAYGRFVGFLLGTITYVIIPLVLSNQILQMVKLNFNPSTAVNKGDESFWFVSWSSHLGNWSSLTFDLMGVVLVSVFILFAFLGSKMFKKTTKYLLIVKWATAAFFVLCGIMCMFLSTNANGQINAAYNISQWGKVTTEPHSLTISAFSNAFCACFYFFTGFEVYAASGATVQEPEKNIGKGIIIVMFAATIFYLAITVIFFFASSSMPKNVNVSFWVDFKNSVSWLRWLLYAGPIIMLISTISMRSALSALMCLYGGTSLQPLSYEGYISERFAKLDSHHFPMSAMKANLVVTTISIAAWAIIPDIICGVLGPNSDFININTIQSAASIFYSLIYIFIILTVLKFAIKKIIIISMFETILYFIAAFFLCFIVVYHFVGLFQAAFNSSILQEAQAHIKNLTALLVEFLFFIGVFSFIIGTYFGYYTRKYRKNLQINPKLQIEKNAAFRVLTGWDFFCGYIGYKTSTFLSKRIVHVNENYANTTDPKFMKEYKEDSIKYAKKVKKLIDNFLISIKNIEAYNLKCQNHDFNEAQKHSMKAKQLLSLVQKEIRKSPRDYQFEDVRSIHNLLSSR